MADKNARTVTRAGARHRARQPSGGLVAISAVLLAASAAASSPVTAAPGAPVVRAPAEEPAVTSADGGTRPDVTFPLVESHLASSRFVHALPPSTTGTIPSAVLAAYQRAVERTNMVQPNCHIPLELLAAIGKIESGHARGGRVDATGRTLTPILGPVLNGGPFAAIRDTDGGALDGDTTWDRAVGPMQFIPGTWTKWQADGDNDGRLDPHNVYDASLAAARYLCAANRDLGTPAGLDAAVLSYNHSTSYLSLVRSWMSIYQAGTVSVDDIVEAGWSPPTEATPPPTTSPAMPPSTTPPPPPPSSTPPPSTPPPTSPPPTTPPPSTPPPTTPPPTTPPPTTEPAPEPVPEAPAEEPAAQCGLLGTVGAVVGGLLGESPECVLPLELSTAP